MKVLEFEAKSLLAERGLRTPRGQMVTTAEDAALAARTLNQPVVIKAQIPTGGRMKAGGVKFADTPEAAEAVAQDLLGRTILGFKVDTLLVEEKLALSEANLGEVFVGVTYDGRTRRAALLASRAGGIEVESNHNTIQRSFSLLNADGVPDYVGREVAAELGFTGAAFVRLSGVMTGLIKCFLEWDAILLEVNPLLFSADGQWVVADVHLELDDDAGYRHKDLPARIPRSTREADQRSEFERKAAEIDSADHRGVAGRLVPFGGDLGLLIGGGGASLTIMDAMLDAGLKPANYCEIGGNPSVWKIKELTKLILQQPGVSRLAVMMNVVSNTRVDLVARGVVKGVLELGRVPNEVITAFRIPGSWEDEGQAILKHYGIAFFDRNATFDQVVDQIKAGVTPGAPADGAPTDKERAWQS